MSGAEGWRETYHEMGAVQPDSGSSGRSAATTGPGNHRLSDYREDGQDGVYGAGGDGDVPTMRELRPIAGLDLR